MLTTALPLNAFPPALADTTIDWTPPAEAGAVMVTRICDANASAATVKAAETKASETAALLAAADTVPCPASASLVRTDPWDSLVLKPTTWPRTPDLDKTASV
jgi:hypothetical protein